MSVVEIWIKILLETNFRIDHGEFTPRAEKTGPYDRSRNELQARRSHL